MFPSTSKARIFGGLLLAFTLHSTVLTARADNHENTVTTEQQKIQVDTDTGDTTHQQRTETNKDTYHASPNGAHAESEHSTQKSAEQHSGDGVTTDSQTSDKSKTSVHTNEAGGTVIDQTKQHSESNAVH